jgi:predicted alpha/beta superfamily hydrolase
MKLLFCIFAFFILHFFSQKSEAQDRVTFKVHQLSSQHAHDSIFIAGSFNGWDPGNSKYGIDTASGQLTLVLAQGSYEYKFTRGSWQKVETTTDGKGVPNRVLKVTGDTTINIDIPEWSDDFKQEVPAERKHTASVNVTIIDTAFFIPQLNRHRRIWLYLPPDYKGSGKSYSVLYMQDGQNLFDDATSYSGEWGVDEYLDSIFALGQKEVIVVGIDNGLAKRMNEYNPFAFENYGKGEGAQYVDFMVKTLKPFIDKHYRTLTGKKDTYIAGSSMGGLISFYAELKYPSVFGGAGIFSPAFWTAPALDSLIRISDKKMAVRLFFYAGRREGKSMIPDMQRIESEIKTGSHSTLHEVTDPEASHNEAAWRKYFPAFYQWTILQKYN